MTTQEKKDEIKSLVMELLETSRENMIKNIDKALRSVAIDIDGWDERYAKFKLPKTIATAILEQEATNWDGTGTGYEKEIKKEVKNIRYFL